MPIETFFDVVNMIVGEPAVLTGTAGLGLLSEHRHLYHLELSAEFHVQVRNRTVSQRAELD
jgi:hypothetical protein